MNGRHSLTSVSADGASAIADRKHRRRARTFPGTVKTGGSRMIPIDGGKYRVWTKRVGEGKIKVLALHGGPGGNHMYLECMEDFLPRQGIELYYHDQLGGGFSDNPDDEGLWTLERYTTEVEQVRQALGLKDFYLFGHSFGGMLAYEYAVKYGQHLKGLIISNMVASVPAYVGYVNKLRSELPADVKARMRKYERKSEYEVQGYQKILFEHVYTRHLCRLKPWPEPFVRGFRYLNARIYNYMQGPSEFTITGTLKDWDCTGDLQHIRTRALVIGARFDTMDPEEMRRIAMRMPHARAAISKEGSHMTMYDDQQWYFRELIRFLKAS